MAESIIPTPQSFQKIDDIIFYDSTVPNFHLPVIVLPQNPAPADIYSCQNITGKNQRGFRPGDAGDRNSTAAGFEFSKDDYSFNDILKAKLVFSIGRNKVYQKVQPRLPLAAVQDKPQGYVIKAAQIGNTHIVFLNGETPLARYYAAATAIQLFEADKAVYHNATVVDYPDFLGRSYVFKSWKNFAELQDDLNSLSRLSLYKLNKVYLGYNRPGVTLASTG